MFLNFEPYISISLKVWATYFWSALGYKAKTTKQHKDQQ